MTPAPGRAAGSSRTATSSTATTRPSGIRSTEVRLLAPVQPRKFLAIGLNYADHIAESGMEAPQFPVFFNKQVTCVVGPGGRRPHAARLEPARLRGRAGDRDRRSLPPRAGRPRARGDRRLHDHQRRLGARLAAAHADDDDGQVVRHPRPARTVAGHAERARRPARPRDPDVRQRRAAPGRQHPRDDLRLLSSRSHTCLRRSRSSRRRDRHRHACRDRRRAPAVPGGLAQGRRRRTRSRSTGSASYATPWSRSPRVTSPRSAFAEEAWVR